MRTLTGCAMAVALVFAAAAAADEKIEEKKLVGKWEPKDQKDLKMLMEFSKDGKLSVRTSAGDMEFTVGGSWKLDGNKLMIHLKEGENEIKDTVTISKLTDDELIGESATKKSKETFRRVK